MTLATPIGEVLPAETIRRLVEFLAAPWRSASPPAQ